MMMLLSLQIKSLKLMSLNLSHILVKIGEILTFKIQNMSAYHIIIIIYRMFNCLFDAIVGRKMPLTRKLFAEA